jgi:predicted transposase YdaD
LEEEIKNWEGSIMLSYEEEFKNEGKKELKTALRLLLAGKTVEQVSEELDIPLDEIKELEEIIHPLRKQF